jgi:hypothetical protein
MEKKFYQLYELLDIKYNINLGECITHIGEEYENFPKEIQESYDKLYEQLGLDIPEL